MDTHGYQRVRNGTNDVTKFTSRWVSCNQGHGEGPRMLATGIELATLEGLAANARCAERDARPVSGALQRPSAPTLNGRAGPGCRSPDKLPDVSAADHSIWVHDHWPQMVEQTQITKAGNVPEADDPWYDSLGLSQRQDTDGVPRPSGALTATPPGCPRHQSDAPLATGSDR